MLKMWVQNTGISILLITISKLLDTYLLNRIWFLYNERFFIYFPDKAKTGFTYVTTRRQIRWIFPKRYFMLAYFFSMYEPQL